MKKLSIFAGFAAVFASVVFYFRPHPVSTPPVDPIAVRAFASAPARAVEQTAIAQQTEQKNTQVTEKLKPQVASSQSAVPDELPPPEPLIDESVAQASEIELWRLPEGEARVMIDDLPARKFVLDPGILASLHVGQVVRIPLSEGAGEIEAEIRQTYNDPTGVQVWKGKVKNDVHQASIIISRGNIQTHVVIATTQGNYSAVVDNRSGDGTLINESAIHSRQMPYDDGIVYRPGETDTPHQP